MLDSKVKKAETKIKKNTLNMVEIETEKCKGCGLCIEVCPTHALFNQKGVTLYDAGKCDGCGKCEGMCIAAALTFYPKRGK
jgi:2-oxoglutarate ferredoxin oxidoreductase subunit delta